MSRWRMLAGFWLAGAAASAAAEPPVMPLPVDFAESATHRWLRKPVFESRPLDDMEDLATWSLVETDQAKGELSLTEERSHESRRSLRLRTKNMPDTPGTQLGRGRPWGTVATRRKFDRENWTGFNRISFWVYPSAPGLKVISPQILLDNAGPLSGDRTEMHHAVLRNNEWNHVVWEIPNIPRDQVTGLRFVYVPHGREPGTEEYTTFDLDQLTLERVEPDYVEGWGVWPGRLAYSHSGYPTGAPKTAFASDLATDEFQVVDQASGQIVLTGRVERVTSPIGTFQVLDFSAVRQPGRYVVRAGDRATLPFPIGPDVWTNSLWKAVNFFYSERCGDRIAGIHDICHRDWQVAHGDRRIVVNGGWHDAGDLCQGLVNTGEAVHAMFSLAERMETTGADPELRDRLIAEANWGLDWVIKTSFHDGYRPVWGTLGYWTNGILGDADDMVFGAANQPVANFVASAAEAVGARVLRTRDRDLAARSLQAAEEDWRHAVDGMSHPTSAARGSVQRDTPLEAAAYGALASLELLQATGKSHYREKAVELARIILAAQERNFLPDVDRQFTGFFYTAPGSGRIQRYIHRGHEQAPVVALARLCAALPDHPDWIGWYSAVLLHSEFYQARMAEMTGPYHWLPNSVFRDDGFAEVPEQDRAIVREQVRNGFPIGGEYFVRAFPVQPRRHLRGSNGTVLSQTLAVSAAAHLRGSLRLADLGQAQLQFVVGQNPFSASIMYGEGHDFAPHYSAVSGDIAGSLPVGIKSSGNRDVPYWPTATAMNYKEVWVHPVARWIGLMRDLAGPARVTGRVAPGVTGTVNVRESRFGSEFTVQSDAASGHFALTLPEGEYVLSHGQTHRHLTALPGGAYHTDLRKSHTLDLAVVGRTGDDGTVTLEATVTGTGEHRLAVRFTNLQLDEAGRTIVLTPDHPAKVTWQARIVSPATPWVAVVIADGDVSRRTEAFGSLRTHSTRP